VEGWNHAHSSIWLPPQIDSGNDDDLLRQTAGALSSLSLSLISSTWSPGVIFGIGNVWDDQRPISGLVDGTLEAQSNSSRLRDVFLVMIRDFLEMGTPNYTAVDQPFLLLILFASVVYPRGAVNSPDVTSEDRPSCCYCTAAASKFAGGLQLHET
jgi:hypothetical protein